nr:aminoacyl-tRNA hydrolase [Synechococcus sp. PCC 6312]
MPQLIVGLGNPGEKYAQTRHNIGFRVIDALAQAWHISLTSQSKFHGLLGEGIIPGQGKIRLLKPTTYMNQSGQSLRAVLDWYKLPLNSILVIYDDADLALGRVRIRLSGSAGGHNGMRSIISHGGSEEFPRLRVGIANEFRLNQKGPRDAVPYVLANFSSDDLKLLPDVLDLAVAAVTACVQRGVEQSMNLYNGRVLQWS